MPEPPAQHKEWVTPANSLSPNDITAVKTLFDQGLADPRECVYGEITVSFGSVWGGSGVTKTRGWVLPGEGTQRFAVCWNGLVYPVTAVGPARDWREDARSSLAKVPDDELYGLSEGASLSWESHSAIKGCVALRLGEVELCLQDLWKAAQKDGLQSHFNGNDERQGPYMPWANAWIWALFDRAVCAHMRGDDKLALLSLRMLAKIQPGIEQEAERRGLKRPQQWDGPTQKFVPTAYLSIFFWSQPPPCCGVTRNAGP